MFKTRLLSGIVLMAITIALMVYGGYPLQLVWKNNAGIY